MLLKKPFWARHLGIWALACSALVLASCGGSSDVAEESAPDPCLDADITQLAIETENQASIVSKDDYIRAQMTLSCVQNPTHNLTVETRIRGRGNSTWGMPKKPYKLKLDDAASLLGMSEGKSWALLANYADKSLLRNELAFHMARHLNLPYTPQSRMLELTLNGEYQGVYQLTNKVYEVTDLVKADKKLPSSENELASGFSDVFLLEMDARLDLEKDDGFISQSGIPYKFRSDTDAEETLRIANWMNGLEELLDSGQLGTHWDAVNRFIDLDSLSKLYWVNELTGNVDGFGWSSTYLYRLRDGRLNYGPVWDFDLALGNNDYSSSQYPEEWYTISAPWAWPVRALLTQPEFSNSLQEQGQQLIQDLPLFLSFIDGWASKLDQAQQRNFERWPILGTYVWPNPVVFDTYEEEVAYLKNWLIERAAWLETHIDELGTTIP